VNAVVHFLSTPLPRNYQTRWRCVLDRSAKQGHQTDQKPRTATLRDTSSLREPVQQCGHRIVRQMVEELTHRIDALPAGGTSSHHDARSPCPTPGGSWSRHLLPFFSKMKANKVSSATLRDYIEKAKRTRRLKRFYQSGAVHSTKCVFARLRGNSAPRRRQASFKRLPESRPRSGFVEEAQFRAILANCKELSLRAMTALA
jgi:hypothetical protein